VVIAINGGSSDGVFLAITSSVHGGGSDGHCRQQLQWRLMAAVDGGSDGLHQRWSSSTEAAVGYSANGSVINGSSS